MTIKELCYELYKIDWESAHITPKIKMDNLKNFYEENKENGYPYSVSRYDEYLMEVGYNGEIYACFDEFINNEYQNEGYIMALLDNEELFEEYLKDTQNPETVYTDTTVRGLMNACEKNPDADIFALINDKKIPIDWTNYIEDEILYLEANNNSIPLIGKNAVHYMELEATDECWFDVYGSQFFNCELCVADAKDREDFDLDDIDDNDLYYNIKNIRVANNEILLVF